MELQQRDGVVRSIAIAGALVERLAELSKAPAVSFTGALSYDAAQDALSLRIGEAQQIAPEVWRHLDEARRAIADNASTTLYDEIRAAQDGALLATSSIEVTRRLDYLGLIGGNLRVITSKSVSWDSRMLLRAVAACAVLREARSDVDWAALDREDRAQIEAVGSLHTARWKSSAKALAVLGVIAGIALGAAFLMKGEKEAPVAEGPSATERAAGQAQANAKVVELTKAYEANPCDKQTMNRLSAYLYAVGDKAKSDAIVDKFRADCPDAK